MLGVEGAGEAFVGLEHPEGHDLEALALDPVDDLAHEAAADAVGLHEHEGALQSRHRAA